MQERENKVERTGMEAKFLWSILSHKCDFGIMWMLQNDKIQINQNYFKNPNQNERNEPNFISTWWFIHTERNFKWF